MDREKLISMINVLVVKRMVDGLTCTEEANLNVLKGGLENGKTRNN